MNPKTKEKIYLLIIVLLIAISGQFYYSYHYVPEHEINVYYNKDHKLNQEIIKLTQDAKKFVYFGIYTFTKEDLKDALLAAKYRGLDVRGVTDRNQTRDIELQNKIVKDLRQAGIPVFEHDHSAIMHLKVLVTEKAYASGSYNWTASATNSNDEVLEVGNKESLRKEYENILKELFEKYKHSNGI
jgi:phosphatidylserine/phosphatidylglycerophosphate/cardiolipin synthase-like enzyme